MFVVRYILHSDLNNFYASVECLCRPEIKDKPVVVTGDGDKRHGVVLAKNLIAKKQGVKTGDTIFEAKQKCGAELVCVVANFDKYIEISHKIKEFYRTITPKVESFGIDEAWLDISHKAKSFEEAYAIADNLRKGVFETFGLTVSIGVSFNKVFAKLGSDLKKPNAVTLISNINYKQLIYPLPCEDLLYVGRATKEKLHRSNIFTIGDLANSDTKFIHKTFGKVGDMLVKFASGQDDSEVIPDGLSQEVKSISNSSTCPRDLKTDSEVKALIYMLAEHVAQRMRHKNLYCRVVSLWVRDDTLASVDKRYTLPVATNVAGDIASACYKLFKSVYKWQHNVRAVGVGVSNFTDGITQCNLFESVENQEKRLKLEKTVENIQQKFGYNAIKRGSVVGDKNLDELNPFAGQHIVHPTTLKK